ncbi:alpha-glucosidase/alpha-galactosidase [Deinococcus sp. KSM4-11]|uniref:family 4 glycosyl hydrolase n=1 Tax=Deinococcus sp. KSM4-11 TaxID=2568654 RepID=UPI0010A35DD8|nr:alpha-glucosidase/alpha-galactosidase [Deinococcus sp. KSM4-11]THF85467.1 alpha-glucosidase/alpha-galactosidase [Deinococcus sp. KSM4-11]
MRPVARVVISGAGGMVFPLTLAADFLALLAPLGAELVLHDPDVERAARTATAVRGLADHHGRALRLSVTAVRREALRGATHVLLTFQVGGLDAYRMDIGIPRRYGVDCPAGDTLGPGGIFRFLRSTSAFDALAADVRDVCPDALVLNYTNPMAMNVLYLHALGVRALGLCHSIPHTAALLEDVLDVPSGELTYRAAGINHQAWFLTLGYRGHDLHDRLRDTLRRRFLPEHGGHTPWTEGHATYVGGQERVRAELMETFGHFLSESSHHVSEYVPYFRRTPEAVRAVLPRRWDYLRSVEAGLGHEQATLDAAVAARHPRLEPSAEYGMRIVAATVGGAPQDVYVNVINAGLIANLPADACVEVPAVADTAGVTPQPVGRLPAACAGLNLTNVAVQLCAVEAAVQRDPTLIEAAVALDPLTASVLDLRDIRRMTRDLIGAQRPWLPAWADGTV